jgi:hypothetical protein
MASGYERGKNAGGYGKGTRLEPTPTGEDDPIAQRLNNKDNKKSVASGGCC